MLAEFKTKADCSQGTSADFGVYESKYKVDCAKELGIKAGYQSDSVRLWGSLN